MGGLVLYGGFPLSRNFYVREHGGKFYSSKKIETRYEVLRLIVKLSEVRLSLLRAIFHIFTLFYFSQSGTMISIKLSHWFTGATRWL